MTVQKSGDEPPTKETSSDEIHAEESEQGSSLEGERVDSETATVENASEPEPKQDPEKSVGYIQTVSLADFASDRLLSKSIGNENENEVTSNVRRANRSAVSSRANRSAVSAPDVVQDTEFVGKTPVFFTSEQDSTATPSGLDPEDADDGTSVDNDALPTPLLRRVETTPGAVSVRGPGFVGVEADTEEQDSFLESESMQSERQPEGSPRLSNQNQPSTSDGGEHLIQAVAVDENAVPEAQVLSQKDIMKRRFLGAGIVAICIIIIVVLSVKLTSSNNNGTRGAALPTVEPSSEIPSFSPTSSPTTSIQTQLETMVEEVSFNITLAELFEDEDSPESAALRWVEKKDYSMALPANRMLQRFILATLYYSTGGDQGLWVNSDGWLTEEDECTWYSSLTEDGICDSDTNDYLVLDLRSNGLDGTMPFLLSLLPNLKHINLSKNKLTGTIPTEIAQISTLNFLYLNENRLEGTIPAGILTLDNLYRFHVHDNKLTGSIPTDYSLSLSQVYLSKNPISGSIPTEIGLAARLMQLKLSYNNLSGSIPSEIGKLGGIGILEAKRSMLTGPLPSEIATFEYLENLDLEYNSFSGVLPFEHVGGNGLRILTNCNLMSKYDDNGIAGTIPTELGLLTRLEALYLAYNFLTGKIPSEIGMLTNLETLELYGNQLGAQGDAMPSEIGLCENLREFDLIFNYDFTSTIPSELGTLENLERLSLAYTSIEGTISSELGQLASLTWFMLQGNNLTGSLPSELGLLENAVKFFVHINTLTGAIPSELGQLTLLTLLKLENNEFNSTIPSEIASCDILHRWHLSGNNLESPIPPEIFNMTSLERFYLENNAFTGPLPTAVGLKPLVTLNLAYNLFTGSIPSEIAGLDPRFLFLHDNGFTGTVPTEIGLWERVELFAIFNNDLVGQIPERFCTLGTSLTFDCENHTISCWDDHCSDGDTSIALQKLAVAFEEEQN